MSKAESVESLQKKLDAANARIDELQGDAEVSNRQAWREDDYIGPLDAVQAAWRNANIKPVVEKTKPAVEVITK